MLKIDNWFAQLKAFSMCSKWQ